MPKTYIILDVDVSAILCLDTNSHLTHVILSMLSRHIDTYCINIDHMTSRLGVK